MNLNRKKNKVFLLIGLLVVSCSPKISHNVLSFFFDGLPDPIVSSDITPIDTLNNNDTQTKISTLGIPSRPSLFFHYPYQEKECMSCHDENSIGNLTMPEPDLCYMCHEDFNNEFKFLHGPVSAGYCTLCHEPHMSETEKLLVKPGQDLCIFCHNSKNILNNEPPTETEDSDCINCHNPHGGNEKNLFLSDIY